MKHFAPSGQLQRELVLSIPGNGFGLSWMKVSKVWCIAGPFFSLLISLQLTTFETVQNRLFSLFVSSHPSIDGV
jgi:hypothetical protein